MYTRGYFAPQPYWTRPARSPPAVAPRRQATPTIPNRGIVATQHTPVPATSKTAQTSRRYDDDDDSSDSDSSEDEDGGCDANGRPDQNGEATNDAAEADSEREEDSDDEDEDEAAQALDGDEASRAADATGPALQATEDAMPDDDLEAVLERELSQSLDRAEDESDEGEWEEATIPETTCLTLTSADSQSSPCNLNVPTPDTNGPVSVSSPLSTSDQTQCPGGCPSLAPGKSSASPASNSIHSSPITPPKETTTAEKHRSEKPEGQSRRVKVLAERKRRRQTPTASASTSEAESSSPSTPPTGNLTPLCPYGDYPSCGGRCSKDLTPAEAGPIHGTMRRVKNFSHLKFYRVVEVTYDWQKRPTHSYIHVHDPKGDRYTANDIKEWGFTAGADPELIAKLKGEAEEQAKKSSSPPAVAIEVVCHSTPTCTSSTGSVLGSSATDVIDLTCDGEDNAPSVPTRQSSPRKTRRPRVQASSLTSSDAGPSGATAASQTRNAPRQSSFAKPRNGNSSTPAPAQSYSPYAPSFPNTTQATQLAPTSLINLVAASAISYAPPRLRGAYGSLMSTETLVHKAFATDSKSATTHSPVATASGTQANPWTSSLWLPPTQAQTSSQPHLPPVPPPSVVPQIQSPVPDYQVGRSHQKQSSSQSHPGHLASGQLTTDSRRPQTTRSASAEQTSQPIKARVSANMAAQVRTAPASRCGTPRLKAQHSFTLSGVGPLTSAGQPLPALTSEPSSSAPQYYQPQWSAYQQRQFTTEAPTPISRWGQARGPGYHSSAAPPATCSAAAYGYSHYAVAPISGQKRKNEDAHARNSRRTKW